MNRELIIRINGKLAPNNKISLRTISHTLPHFQRAIDKIVLYEKYGEIKKHSSLPAALYEYADLYLDPFEPGSVKIPLVGELLAGVSARLNQFLKEPYEKAANEFDSATLPLSEQLITVKNNVRLDNVAIVTQESLLANGAPLEHSFAQAACLRDLNNMLAPLRAKSSSEDTISIINNSTGNAANYEFDHQSSKSFSKIVTHRRLASPVIYRGRLEALKRSKSTSYPCIGTFVSDITGQEMSLLFASEEDAFTLHSYNLRNLSFSIWACPLAIYESFDQARGDIVFVSFIEALA